MKKILLFAVSLLVAVGSMQGQDRVYTSYDNNGTLTYYYDARTDRTIMEDYDPTNFNGRWTTYHASIHTVVIDASMKNAPLTSMHHLFFGNSYNQGGNYVDAKLSNMTTIRGIDNLKTTNVTDMTEMFRGCESLTSIYTADQSQVNVIPFNTAKVEKMESMFQYCGALQTIDISAFNITSLKNTKSMFAGCTSLTTIYCDQDWSESTTLGSSSNMFHACSALKGGNGTAYRSQKVDKELARPEYSRTLSMDAGYFTYPTWDGDLANVKGKVYADEGKVITGTFSPSGKTRYNVNILPGVHVTLDNVYYESTSYGLNSVPAINCMGDAYIVLKGNNTVYSYNGDQPAIFIQKNHTLYIQEHEDGGSLNATGRTNAAAIGGGNGIECGSIYLEGGTIVAQGGKYGAGIGGGYNAACGYIYIYEGHITAIGGEGAAGIGGGMQGDVKQIDISNDVTYVYAKSGTTGVYSVGPGQNGDSQYGVRINYEFINTGIEENPFIYQPRIDNVVALIDAIGDVNNLQDNPDTRAKIQAAEEALLALTVEEQQQVPQDKKLALLSAYAYYYVWLQKDKVADMGAYATDLRQLAEDYNYSEAATHIQGYINQISDLYDQFNSSTTFTQADQYVEQAKGYMENCVNELLSIMKNEVMVSLEYLRKDGDSEAVKKIIDDAETLVTNFTWDYEKSVKDNDDLFNGTFSQSWYLDDVKAAVEAQRQAELQGIEEVQGDKVQSTKILRDGQLLILVGDKTYDARGIEIKK